MLWKVILVATFVAGVFGEPQFQSQQKQHLHNYIEKQCTKNNAKEKTEQAEAGIYTFMNCIIEHLDPSILTKVGDISDKRSVIEVYRGVCRNVPEFKTCFFTLFDDIAVCGGKNATEEITKGKNFLDDLFEYLCGNDAEKFVKFVSDDSLQCLTQKKAPLKSCGEKVMKGLGSIEGDSDEPSSAGIKEACATFNNVSKCIHTALVECTTNTASEFLDGMAELTRKASRCN